MSSDKQKYRLTKQQTQRSEMPGCFFVLYIIFSAFGDVLRGSFNFDVYFPPLGEWTHLVFAEMK